MSNLTEIIHTMRPPEGMALAYEQSTINPQYNEKHPQIYSWNWKAGCYSRLGWSLFVRILVSEQYSKFWKPIPDFKDLDWENPQRYIMSPGADYMRDTQSNYFDRDYGVFLLDGARWIWNGVGGARIPQYRPIKGRFEILEKVK